jgi:hypothetical protein
MIVKAVATMEFSGPRQAKPNQGPPSLKKDLPRVGYKSVSCLILRANPIVWGTVDQRSLLHSYEYRQILLKPPRQWETRQFPNPAGFPG